MRYLHCLVAAAVLAISCNALAEEKKPCTGDDCIVEPTHSPGKGTGIDTKGVVPNDVVAKDKAPVASKSRQ